MPPRHGWALLAPFLATAPVACALTACGQTTPTAGPAGHRSESTSPSPPHPAAVYPLTGLPVTNPTTATRPALSIKIDNVRGSFPQAGLNDADIVCDALVEGGMTRLMAVYQSHDAPLVGPIRSARPVDADLVRLWGGGAFAYSGAAQGEIAPMIDHGNSVRISYDENRTPFRQLASRPRPHHVFAATPTLYAVARARGAAWQPPPQLFTYRRVPLRGASVTNVTLTFSPRTQATWHWADETYVRTQDGAPGVLIDGRPVRSSNIVIIGAVVAHTGIFDTAGEEDPLDVVLGAGPAWVMHDGQMIAGRWQRPRVSDRMRLVDTHDEPIPLRPGTTWIEILPRPNMPTFH